MNYGQTRPFESGKSIELAEAQVLDKANITMPRGSAISGRIVDEFGEPVADAQVTRAALGLGERTAAAAASRPAPRRRTISVNTGSTACLPASTTSARRCAAVTR